MADSEDNKDETSERPEEAEEAAADEEAADPEGSETAAETDDETEGAAESEATSDTEEDADDDTSTSETASDSAEDETSTDREEPEASHEKASDAADEETSDASDEDGEAEITAGAAGGGDRDDSGGGDDGGGGSDDDGGASDSEPERPDDDQHAEVMKTARERRPDAGEERYDALREELRALEESYSTDRLVASAVLAIDADVPLREVLGTDAGYERREAGVAAFFDHPDELLEAAARTRDSEYEEFDAYSPFPIHGMDEAMGLERSWIPWVTFTAGLVGFLSAVALEFGTMTFDWPIIIGGKPFAPWPAFVPVMFELTVLIGGVTTGVVMLRAAGCFEPADVLDPDITNDRFALWISGEDEEFEQRKVIEFVERMDPVEVRTFTEEKS